MVLIALVTSALKTRLNAAGLLMTCAKWEFK
jgi:hypothetical protein